jgi:hypothetical protein
MFGRREACLDRKGLIRVATPAGKAENSKFAAGASAAANPRPFRPSRRKKHAARAEA